MTTLKQFIDSEPANAGRTDAEVFAWSNEAVTVQTRVSRNKLIGWTVAGNILKRLEDLKDDEAKGALARAALAVVNGPDGLDTGDPEAQALLAAMVSLEMLTQAEVDALNARGALSVPRWQAAGIGQPHLGHIEHARA